MELSGQFGEKVFIRGNGIPNRTYQSWEIKDGNLYLYYHQGYDEIMNINKINIETNDADLDKILDDLKNPEQNAGKRKSRRNRKSKKSKRSRKARKSRRKSNRRRGRR